MARLVTFVLSGAASLALIACDQGPAAEAKREADAVEAMTNDLRSDAEEAAKGVDSQRIGKSGRVADHSRTDKGSMAAKADPASN